MCSRCRRCSLLREQVPDARVLFIVNGLGLGNSTRCDAIIQQMDHERVSVDVVTSGNGVDYFERRGYVNIAWEMRSLEYRKNSDGRLSMFQTFRSLPLQCLVFMSNVRALRRVVAQGDYRAIVIDSDYTLWGWRKVTRARVFALNNANVVVRECRKHGPLPLSARPQFLVEKMDSYFHRLLPDWVISPALSPGASEGHVLQCPPFVRKDLKVRQRGVKVERLLVMLSGSAFGSTTSFLERLDIDQRIVVDVVGREGVSSGRITYHGKVFENADLLNRADIMVINGGFSAVSEAAVLKIPAVVIPVENHAEQWINAKLFEDMGLGLIASVENVNEKLCDLVDNYARFIGNHRESQCRTGGALHAAELIERAVRMEGSVGE
jgi:uncharacterized protein (TIGR00661 family)